MDWTSWFALSWPAVWRIVAAALCIYVVVIVLARLAGLRSFSKMSAFDFSITIAAGTIIGSTVLTPSIAPTQGAVALAALYALQKLVAVLRRRVPAVSRLVDNRPLLLMDGPRFIEDNMRRANVTHDDIRAKLRAANVIDMSEVKAVVLETTGDISVLHGVPQGKPLSGALLEGVTGTEALSNLP